MTITAPTPALNRSRTPDPSLVALLQRVVDDCDRWLPLVRFDTDERYWVRLDVPEDVDVWLLTWTTAQGTELHDHGDSEAAFAVISGVLSETRVRDDELVVLERRPGTVVSVLPGELHDVRNELPEPAISIHAYSPRLATMTFYSFGDGRATPVRTVHGDIPEVD